MRESPAVSVYHPLNNNVTQSLGYKNEALGNQFIEFS